MRKSIPLSVLGLIMVCVGIGGQLNSIFMAQNSVGMLHFSPMVNLILFIAISLVGCALFVIGLQKDYKDEETIKAQMILDLGKWAQVYNKEHGYPLSRSIVNDTIEYAVKRNNVVIRYEGKDEKKG